MVSDKELFLYATNLMVDVLRLHGDRIDTGTLYLYMEEEEGVDARMVHDIIVENPKFLIGGQDTVLVDLQVSTSQNVQTGLTKEEKEGLN